MSKKDERFSSAPDTPRCFRTRAWTPAQRKKQAKVARFSAANREKKFNENPDLKRAHLIKRAGGNQNEFVQFRIRLNMFQGELADAIERTVETIANWERGRVECSCREDLDRLAVEKGVEPINWEKV